MNPAAPPLPLLAALARAGAVDRAAELFARAYDARSGDPAVLAVQGRLLKSQARLAAAGDSQRLMGDAAAAYAAAHRLDPQPYLAINAASTNLLAGDHDAAAALARWVVVRLDDPAPIADTPYYLAATRSEALLILGDQAGAEAAMATAASADPDGWDQRAVTIAQLEELTAAQGRDVGWLDPFRPPAALHFAGHMGVAAGGAAEAAIAQATDRLITAERIGFAFGALAAGADVVIAERVLAAGGELHLVLPAPAIDFRRQSVAPAGEEWGNRFDMALAAATSVQVVGPASDQPHDGLATRLAGDVAIGASLHCARRHATRVLQWVVLDAAGGGAHTATQAARWPDPASQRRLMVARDANPEAIYPAEESDPGRRDAVVLAIRLDLGALGPLPPSAELAAARAPVASALAGVPRWQVRAGYDGWDVLIDDPRTAAALALAVQATPARPAVGLARGLLATTVDPPSGGLVWHGPAAGLAQRLAQRAPGGVVLADALFAGGAAQGGDGPWHLQPYLADEPDLGGTAYLLASLNR